MQIETLHQHSLRGTPGYEEQMFGQQQSKNHHFDFCGLVLDYNEDTKNCDYSTTEITLNQVKK